MESFAFGRRGGARILVAVCVLVLLATAAMGYVRRDPSLSGVWQDWGDSVWEYYYFAPTDCEYWRFKTNQQVRFAYKCTPGQWWQYSSTHGGFSAIGLGGVGNDFLGDDENNHNVSTTWAFTYRWYQDCAYWIDRTQNETRFAYKYGPGQWWDYTSANNGSWTAWSHLGLGALTYATFIGDGEWHTFDTDKMTGGNYLGYTADADFKYFGGYYIWRSNNIERYRFTYGTGYSGTWAYYNGSTWVNMTYSGTWENPDVRYHGGGIFIESGLAWDPGTNRPTDAPNPRQINYNVYYLGGATKSTLTSWTIYNPGTDNKWTGGLLNVLWCHNDWNAGNAEWTIPDVVVFVRNMEGVGFANLVNWMTIVRDYFRQQISTVTVSAHGNDTGWQMGVWMDNSNYSSYYNDWVRWGRLMTTDGQIISLHCETGQAATMLNNIANWTQCDIFANTNTTWTYWYWITSSNEITPSVWNQNQKYVSWTDAEGGSMRGTNRYFEFTTTHAQNYRWVLYNHTSD